MIKKLSLLGAFFFAGMGVYYAGVKFHVPWYTAFDYRDYSLMVEQPLRNSALSPFAYRIVTPTLAHYLKASGLLYKPKATSFGEAFSSYEGRSYDPTTLSALIFANALFFTFAAFVLSEAIEFELRGIDSQMVGVLKLALPAMLFLSLSTVVHGLAGLTEGGSLFFVSLLLYLFHKRSLLAFACIACLSVLQRELIPLILFFYITGLGAKRASAPYLLACVLAFGLFIIIKVDLLPIPGNDEQLNSVAYLRNLLAFRPSGDFLFQAVLSENVVFLSLAFLASLNRLRSSLVYLTPYFFVAALLFVLGIGAGIGSNVGRILNLATPILLLCLARSFRHKVASVPAAA